MTPKQAEYSINELAKEAGVSVRTIRFYINEGLLPPPDTRGRYAVYTAEYLDRLELIRRLKESFLPLKEIRSTLNSLTWEEVRLTLAEHRQREAAPKYFSMEGKTDPSRRAAESHSSALDYISNLLASKPVNRPLPPQQPDRSVQPNLSLPPLAEQQHWQRVTLADGLELHIRMPVRPEDQRKIEELIRWSKKIFS